MMGCLLTAISQAKKDLFQTLLKPSKANFHTQSKGLPVLVKTACICHQNIREDKNVKSTPGITNFHNVKSHV